MKPLEKKAIELLSESLPKTGSELVNLDGVSLEQIVEVMIRFRLEDLPTEEEIAGMAVIIAKRMKGKRPDHLFVRDMGNWVSGQVKGLE